MPTNRLARRPEAHGRYIRLPQWLFNRDRFMGVVMENYDVIAEFHSVDPTAYLADCTVNHCGMIAKRMQII